MFEFRWHRDARELRVGKREQIRHYDAEPLDLIDVVWGCICISRMCGVAMLS